jgi:two-component system sensor histidine kinase/response regulator
MSDLLRARIKDPEHRRFIDIIHNSGHALLKIVNDILDFSKIEAGRIDFEFSDFSLIDSVEATVELYSAPAREKRLALLSYVDPSIPSRVVGDSSRISQILRNLISNAIKFTEDGGVTVRARLISRSHDKSIVRFEVQDTGRGIASDQHRLLFQPFNQVADSLPKREGTGLGLSICKDLTEAMGGAVGFDSAPGRGSTFWCEIPLKPNSEISIGESITVLQPPLSVFFVGIDGPVARLLNQYGSEWSAALIELPDWTSDEARDLLKTSLAAIDPSLATSLESEGRGKPVLFVSLKSPVPDLLLKDLSKIADDRKARIVFVSREALDDLSPKIREMSVEGFLSEPFRREQIASILNGTSNVVPLAAATPPIEKQNSALILLVEDNQTNQLLAELFLAELGHRTHTVANGREAVEALTRISYDVVLMDCQMPVMDGYEATRKIREREAAIGQHTPIIAMTANALDSDKEKCFASGMDDFLAKPFQATDLSEKLRRWVKIEARGAVDWAVLHDLAAKTNATVVSRLIQSFLKTLPASLGEIRKARAENDLQASRAWAHQLKSSSASLGALELHKLCVRLEEAIESTSPAGLIEAATNDLLANGEMVFKEFQAQTRYV